MGTLVDLNSAKRLPNTFLGSSNKLAIMWQGERYMIKFEEPNEKKYEPLYETSDTNAHMSEYLGCHIYEGVGLPVQKTILGTIDGRACVACRDFCYELTNGEYRRKYTLEEFAALMNSHIKSSEIAKTPDLSQILYVYDHEQSLQTIKAEAIERYWQTFIVDAVIGNFDRHCGNWGFLISEDGNYTSSLAPVYDCGSSLSPRLNDLGMKAMLDNKEEMMRRIFTRPLAKLKVNFQHISYHDFLLSDEGADCRQVLLDLYDKIDLAKINSIIDNLPEVSDTRKEYYSKFIAARKEGILKPAYELALKESQEVKAPSVMNALAKEVALKNCTSSEDINHGPNL